MIPENKNVDNWKDYGRIFLDLPYRYGTRHIQLACGIDKRVSDIAKTNPSIEPEVSKLSIKERVGHFVLGVSECIPIIGIIVALVDGYLHKNRFLDQNALITGKHAIEPHQTSWYLNLALLRSAYDSAVGPQKEKIKFLAANFLNKVTPKKLDLTASKVKSIDPEYLSKHQGSPIEEFRYHREVLDQKFDYGKKFNDQLAYQNKSVFILTDTAEVEELFPLQFTVLDKKAPTSNYADTIKQVLSNHFATNKKTLDQNLDRPFLIDVTHIIDAPIQSNGVQQTEKAFIDSFEQFKREFTTAEKSAVEQFIKENPELSLRTADVQLFIDKNITCISRVTMEGASGIKMLPMGACKTRSDQFNSPLIQFVIHTGIYIGAIGLRRITADVFQQRPDIDYGVSKGAQAIASPLYYPTKESFTESHLIQRLSCLFGSSPAPTKFAYGIAPKLLNTRIEYIKSKPHIAVLGKATVDMVQGLLQELDTKKWDQLQKDPILCSVFQTSLFLLREHMAMAEQCALNGDFTTFTNEIELAHAELATLLELTEPFKTADFASIYKNELVGKSVPASLENELQAGLAKTAVNIFAGIAAAAKKEGAILHGVKSEGSYYEQAIFMDHDFGQYCNDPTLAKLDIYLGQFNSNIDVGSTLTDYKRRDIATDIRTLIDNNRVADPFTVAIDLTIDKFHSDNVKDLLSKFEKEIKDGKLNFAFFTSGQKFYTLGMDDYYGSGVYMVNNGEDKWKKFNSLLSKPVHQTDTLSTQWFCLATKYAPDSLDAYRKLIFDNTRYILDRIPENLKPNPTSNQKVRVNRMNADMDACFIDMKVLGSFNYQEKRSREIEKTYHEIMVKHGIKTYGRGSFGFAHQNFAVFGPIDQNARAIRLNPGINPEENDAIIEFLTQVQAF